MKTKIVGLIGMLFLFLPWTLPAQTTLNVPNNVKNTRFYNDVFNVKRPGLSVNGFDDGGDHSKGYGLKQILEMLYNGTADPLMVDTYNKIVQISKQPLYDPFSTNNPLNTVNNNSNKLQSRAFIALARYVLYKNGITAQIPSATQTAPSHSVALSNLKTAFLEPADWLLANSDHDGDQVHWTRTVDNYARALDLYLALENAYDFYGGADQTEYDDPNSTVLLSTTQKKAVMSKLFESMEAINGYLYADALGPVPSGTQNYETESGNRPMKMFLSIGYAALGMQEFIYHDEFAGTSYSTYTPSRTLLQDAFRSGGLQAEKERTKYWSYQTHNGNHFWAEGSYYFELSLLEVLPFWHSIRLNNMLNWNGNNISDPFKNSWFLSPLDWLANLTTPNGDLPPIDDSNKRTIRYSNLMSWNATYSNNTLGKQVGDKFAWIHNRILDNPNVQFSDLHTLLVDIAIPKSTTPQPPKNLSGNDNANQTGNSAKQQLIARWRDLQGARHYLLLNGESGDAIPRGEGHEQADQLQLLYYYAPNASTEESLLMDTGYDHASWDHNSSWNVYRLQNVMSIDNAPNGGLPGPITVGEKMHKVADHAPVNYLYKETHGLLDVLKGQVNIKHYSTTGQFIYTTKNSRNIIVVRKDPDHSVDSYFVDIASNDDRPLSISGSEALRHDVHMRYYSDTQSYTHHPLGWSKFDHGSKDLYLFSKPVEWKLLQDYDTYYSTDYLAREVQGRDIGDPADQKGYYVSYRGLGGTSNPDSKSWNIVTIFDLAESQPQYTPNELISYAADNYARTIQAWEYQHSSNVVDVIVKRAKSKDNTDFDSDITFNISDADDLPLRLPANKDYGFARLYKVNGVWKIGSNYQINLIIDPNAFVDNSSIGTKTYPSNAHIYIADNKTLTINGDVTMQPGTIVRLGKDASINVSSGGRIDANGTTFQTISGSTASSDRWSHIKLFSDNNDFRDCTIEGGQYGVYAASGSAGNEIRNSELSHNTTGLYVNGGSTSLNGSTVEHNTVDGIVIRGSGSMTTNSTGSGLDFQPSVIRDNPIGIRILDYGYITANLTKFIGNNYHVSLSEQGRAFLGTRSIDYSTGDYYYYSNEFLTGGTLDIANSALTSGGSDWTAQAMYNWWGGGCPSESRFSGPVEYSPVAQCDATTDGSNCGVQECSISGGGSGGDGGGTGGGSGGGCTSSSGQITTQIIDPCVNSLSTTSETGSPNATTNTVDANFGSSSDTKRATIANILTYIHDHPERRSNFQLVQKIYAALQRYDKDGKLWNRLDMSRHLSQWIELYEFSKDASSQGGILTSPLLLHANAIAAIGETAMLLKMDRLLRQGEYQKVLDKSKEYDPYISNKDNRASLWSAKAVAWEQTGQFGKALAAYEKIASFESDAGVDNYLAMVSKDGYDLVTQELADSMSARNQAKARLSETRLKMPKQKEILPQSFEIEPAYPNPFNPTTVIPFALPKKNHVLIEVFNTLGQKVATLADRIYKAGTHKIRFSGKNLSSGIYFIRTEYNQKVNIMKVTLLK